MIFEPGTLVGGRYRLINRIAQGERHDLWRAADRVPDRQVVIRHVARASDDDALAHYLSDASRLVGVAHPSLARVHAVGRTDDGDGWIATELLIAERLDQLLERRGQILPGAALNLVSDLARALAAAHGAGVVHGAISARSVLLHRNGWGQIEPKLVDFGRARIEPTGDGYESPELLSNRRTEAAGDVWALGVLLFRSIVGRLPFRSADPLSRLVETYALDRVLREENNLDDRLRELLGDTLRPDRAQRPSASVLADRTQLLAWLTTGGARDLAKMVRITDVIWGDPAATGVIEHFQTIPGGGGPPLVEEPAVVLAAGVEIAAQPARPEPEPEPEPEWEAPPESEPEPEPEPEPEWDAPTPEPGADAVTYVTPTPDDVFVDFVPRRRRWVPLLAAATAAIWVIALAAPSKPHHSTFGAVAKQHTIARAETPAPSSAPRAPAVVGSVTAQRAIVHRKPGKPTTAAAPAPVENDAERGVQIGNVSGIPLFDPKPRDDNPYE